MAERPEMPKNRVRPANWTLSTGRRTGGRKPRERGLRVAHLLMSPGPKGSEVRQLSPPVVLEGLIAGPMEVRFSVNGC